jgi:hypothetical protein
LKFNAAIDGGVFQEINRRDAPLVIEGDKKEMNDLLSTREDSSFLNFHKGRSALINRMKQEVILT